MFAEQKNRCVNRCLELQRCTFQSPENMVAVLGVEKEVSAEILSSWTLQKFFVSDIAQLECVALEDRPTLAQQTGKLLYNITVVPIVTAANFFSYLTTFARRPQEATAASTSTVFVPALRRMSSLVLEEVLKLTAEKPQIDTTFTFTEWERVILSLRICSSSLELLTAYLALCNVIEIRTFPIGGPTEKVKSEPSSVKIIFLTTEPRNKSLLLIGYWKAVVNHVEEGVTLAEQEINGLSAFEQEKDAASKITELRAFVDRFKLVSLVSARVKQKIREERLDTHATVEALLEFMARFSELFPLLPTLQENGE